MSDGLAVDPLALRVEARWRAGSATTKPPSLPCRTTPSRLLPGSVTRSRLAS